MAALLHRPEDRRGENIDSVDRDFDRKVHVLRNRNGFSVLPRGRDEPWPVGQKTIQPPRPTGLDAVLKVLSSFTGHPCPRL